MYMTTEDSMFLNRMSGRDQYKDSVYPEWILQENYFNCDDFAKSYFGERRHHLLRRRAGNVKR